MASKEAITVYCRAQANINKLVKETDEQRKVLGERVRTFRSLLQDELLTRKMSCVEMTPPGQSEPIYFRIKEGNVSPHIDLNLVLTILKGTDDERLHVFAEKNGHDLPKMLAASLSAEIKERYTKKSAKPSLTISKVKERGFARQHNIPIEVVQLAHDLHAARAELTKVRESDNQRKKVHMDEQRSVEEQVKTALKDEDPVNQMTRVHMLQDGDEWVYYLRRKNKTKKPGLGVRKIVPMVEEALTKTLESRGMGREFANRFCPTVQFWEELATHLSNSIDEELSACKSTSTLTLDRGAPRKSACCKSRDMPP